MRIGMLYRSTSPVLLSSVQRVLRSTERALEDRHELVFRNDEYWRSSETTKATLNKALCEQCDLLIGPVDHSLLEARRTSGRSCRCIVLLLGSTCRGLPELRDCWKLLNDHDLLVGNCSGDIQICRQFFTICTTRLLPLTFDASVFGPAGAQTRTDIRRLLRIPKEAQLVLYAGRITIEKNVQTVIKIFAALQAARPKAHLVLAGDVFNTPFFEFGIYPVDMRRWLLKLAGRLGVDDGRLHFVGRRNSEELAALYAESDVLLTMTLHHDENFGLAPVEAMACGTPCVATHWGGLRDTVRHGETGFTVTTRARKTGVVVDWLSALWHVVALLDLSAQGRATLERNCVERANAQYHPTTYARRLLAIVEEASTPPSSPRSLELSPFGRNYWRTCAQTHEGIGAPAYTHSEHAAAMYRELVNAYTGHPWGDGEDLDEVSDDAVLFAPWWVDEIGDRVFELDDPIFLMPVESPVDLLPHAISLVRRFRAAPWLRAGDVVFGCSGSPDDLRRALSWLVRTGLVIRTAADTDTLEATRIAPVPTPSCFHRERLGLQTDGVIFR